MGFCSLLYFTLAGATRFLLRYPWLFIMRPLPNYPFDIGNRNYSDANGWLEPPRPRGGSGVSRALDAFFRTVELA